MTTWNITTASNIPAVIAGSAAGDTFNIAAGTYTGATNAQNIQPKNNQTFIGPAGTGSGGGLTAIFSGGGSTVRWFNDSNGTPTGVTLQNLSFVGYAGTELNFNCAIGATQNGWNIIDCDFGAGNGIGVYMRGSTTITRGKFHHCLVNGIAGDTVNGGVINGAEVWANNQGGYNQDNTAGGLKITAMTGFTLKNSNIHDNLGTGAWFDAAWSTLLIDNNDITNNQYHGIQAETGDGATITNNRLSGNGVGPSPIPTPVPGNAIFISSSSNCTVGGLGNGNAISVPAAQGHAIVVQADDRPDTHGANHNVVTYNSITFLGSGGSEGLFVYDPANPSLTGTAFDHNTYHVTALGQSHYCWAPTSGASKSLTNFATWQGNSQDLNGTETTGGGGGGGVPTLTQFKLGVDGSAASATTVVLAFNAPVALNGFVWGAIGFDENAGAGPITISSVVDDKGNTYTVADTTNDPAVNGAMSTFQRAGITNAPQTVTVTFSATTDFRRVAMAEFSGVKTASATDGTPYHLAALNTSNSTATDAMTSGTVTTTVNGDLICGATMSPDVSVVATPGTGYTQICAATPGENNTLVLEYKIQAAAGAIAATFTHPSAAHAIINVMAFKAATLSNQNQMLLGVG